MKKFELGTTETKSHGIAKNFNAIFLEQWIRYVMLSARGN